MNRTRSLKGRRTSYTLVEMLIVIALLGLAATLLIPNLVGQDIMSAQTVVRMIIGDLSFAQSDALSHQEFRRVHFFDADGNGNAHGYCITRITEGQLSAPFDDGSADYIRDPLAGGGVDGNYIVNITDDNRFDGVVISSVDIDGGGRDIQYDTIGGTVRSGNLPGLGGSIVVSSANVSYRITIAAFTGKLTVQEL
ncbi:MAG TPA: prepilin-type N-terminal cleavage/methylation domain-containing protein [Phycisphaerales bacterium]|nr:prepilin-type N-terminal cleavage/methylation domain-containing protein [Phycisphaerales bacterium]